MLPNSQAIERELRRNPCMATGKNLRESAKSADSSSSSPRIYSGKITPGRGVRGGEMERRNCPDEIDPQRIGKRRVRRFRRWTQIFCFRPLATKQPPQTSRVEQKWTGGTKEANYRESSSLWLCGSVRTLPFPLCPSNGVDKLLSAGPLLKARVEKMWVMESRVARAPLSLRRAAAADKWTCRRMAGPLKSPPPAYPHSGRPRPPKRG